jgi:hypothetical protein
MKVHDLKWKRAGTLSDWEESVIRDQVRKNSALIDRHIKTIDLLSNREQCPKDACTLIELRKRLDIAMCENDVFRKVLWRHMKTRDAASVPDDELDPVFFLARRMKSRSNR